MSLDQIARRVPRDLPREDRHFRVIDENIRRLLFTRLCWGKFAVALAGIGSAGAMQIKDVVGIDGNGFRRSPAVFSEHEVAYARFTEKLTGIFQPMIEPTQQNRVRVK